MRDLTSARATIAGCRPHRHGCGRAVGVPDRLEWLAVNEDPPCRLRRPPDRRRLLAIHDGPFLEIGLKGIAGTLIDRPRRLDDRPDRDRLAIRFEEFKKVA